MRRNHAFVLTTVVTLVLMSWAATTHAQPAGIPANDIERGVFVDPVPGHGRPGRVEAKRGASTGGEQSASYVYKGLHWAAPTVRYSVNVQASGLSATAADAAVGLGFWTWETENNTLGRADRSEITFVDDGGTSSSGPRADGVNTVSWAPLSSSTLAATYYWYDRRTKHLLEFDIVFNSNVPWTTTGEAGKYDVWNICAHEAGHTLQLGDLYNGAASDLTMYGYGAAGETKKQTLGMGDMLGVERIYPSSL